MAKYGTGRQRSHEDKAQQAWGAEARRAGTGGLHPAARRGRISGAALVYMLCLGLLLGWYGPVWMARFDAPTISMPMPGIAADVLSADFGYCHSGGGTDCVVDGDTFWFRGEKIRIADIDTPETHGPRCVAEGELGARATRRLQALMNRGPFTLETGDRDSDRYGRALRVVTRGGQSIGEQLVAEGLARRWDGARHPWC
ncbi:thermonuclease family protein [Sphingobium sp. CR2-8]|uniref:thermonuclease family protein n=1 Tax=Sphingobium sp. CR2-8 TaxID=1306534 RepID=UPI002DBB6457|nr:thermonuclease family protein [Sphingobium sp. CR2-8]MEC3912617.1 thermonuclease family protein [Sphingobium sp. CR2-8]